VIRFAADENFNNDIVRGLLRREPSLDIVRIQDAGLRTADDPAVLEWCAVQNRILLTHDVATMSDHAYDRVAASLPMSGVFEIARSLPMHLVIEDLLLIAECSTEGEWDNQVRYLPLK